MRRGFLILGLALITLNSFSADKKEIKITRCEIPPKIDGILDDQIWSCAVKIDDFIQYEPYNGIKPSQRTEVFLSYDNRAIYVGAKLYDTATDSILTELSTRDEIHHSNADLFGIMINPFNDGVNMVEFLVSASGVQSDAKHTGGHTDRNWNAVWESRVKIVEDGWIVEMKIPYSALRFPNKLDGGWGLHLVRHIRRYREWDSWTYIDPNQRGMAHQAGVMKGIKDVDPPLRLSLTPYISGYLENNTDGDWGSTFNGGLDLKLGLNESFTLDMTLIPDFGQVQSDDQVLNLSPYEVRYNEKRAFFTEGTELFSKGNVFYSRRVGSEPIRSDEVEDQLRENEIVEYNPSETGLINATKISGRTSGGLGIGIFNAMTSATYATVKDTLIEQTNDSILLGLTSGELQDVDRKILTQGFTNYNMIVLDQNLWNNSYVSLLNTNVWHDSETYTANVTGTEFRLTFLDNLFTLFGRGTYSNRQIDTAGDEGYAYFLQFSKSKGRFQFELSHSLETDEYNPNDLGYLRRNNEMSYNLELEYDINEPFGKFLRWGNSLDFRYSSLYTPREFSRFNISFRSHTVLKNYYSVGMHGNWTPVEQNDFFEPRVDGRVFKQSTSFMYFLWMSTDYRKMLAFDFRFGQWWGDQDYDQNNYWVSVEPKVRASDKLFLSLDVRWEKAYNQLGFVTYDQVDENNYNIDFGKRDVTTLNQEIEANYKFNNKAALSLRIRHYWRFVEYDDYYRLQEDGYLSNSIGYETYGNDMNINYNAFNIDLQYVWRFAPGSELSLVWKNAIYTYDSQVIRDYVDNLDMTLGSPQINSISLKILYYLDYQSVRRRKVRDVVASIFDYNKNS